MKTKMEIEKERKAALTKVERDVEDTKEDAVDARTAKVKEDIENKELPNVDANGIEEAPELAERRKVREAKAIADASMNVNTNRFGSK